MSFVKWFYMNCGVLALLLKVTLSHNCHDHDESFRWGVATAAYQIEGAANTNGRGESIWDSFSDIPGKIENGDNGLIADDSYHKWEGDINLLVAMGMNSYRFSISWTRILPYGNATVNPEGIQYYNNIIDRLVELHIEPFVTIYHWDLPQTLEDRYEGWLSAEVEKDFVFYADMLFTIYGDRVKKWMTFNEPWTFCVNGYTTGLFAPGRCSDRSRCNKGDSSIEGYIAAHNVLNSHAAVVDLYRRVYQPFQNGIIGITLNMDWAEPQTSSAADMKAAERYRQFLLGWFLDPVVYGKYPPAMLENVNSRLPLFTSRQYKLLKGSYDFIGINHYSAKYIINVPYSELLTNGWNDDVSINITHHDSQGNMIGPQADSPWLYVVPWGFYKALKWVKNRYNNPLVYVTENGCDVPNESKMTFPEVLQDNFRVNYYRSYLRALDQAIFEGSRIRGYFAWSLLDNFEWADGYDFRFGLHYIDFNDPERTRHPKLSAAWYASYAATHPYPRSNTPHALNRPIRRSMDSDSNYDYKHVLGPGDPVFGVYGTGY